MLKEVEVIRDHVLRAMLCGSRVTCRPAPTGTDQDVIVFGAAHRGIGQADGRN